MFWTKNLSSKILTTHTVLLISIVVWEHTAYVLQKKKKNHQFAISADNEFLATSNKHCTTEILFFWVQTLTAPLDGEKPHWDHVISIPTVPTEWPAIFSFDDGLFNTHSTAPNLETKTWITTGTPLQARCVGMPNWSEKQVQLQSLSNKIPIHCITQQSYKVTEQTDQIPAQRPIFLLENKKLVQNVSCVYSQRRAVGGGAAK